MIKDKKNRLPVSTDESEDADKSRRSLFESYKELLKLAMNEVVVLGGPQDLGAFEGLQSVIADFFLPDVSTPGKSRRKQHRSKQPCQGSLSVSPIHHNLLEDIHCADTGTEAQEVQLHLFAENNKHFFGSFALSSRRHQSGPAGVRRESADQVDRHTERLR